MSGSRVPPIQLLEAAATPPRADITVFVGGPRNGKRSTLADSGPTIDAVGGVYHRSVHCADDGARRYVFEPEAAGQAAGSRPGTRIPPSARPR
jgi:hypothetical protein